MEALVSDYLTPVLLSLVLLGLWFTGSNDTQRYQNQIITLIGGIAVGFANAQIMIINMFVNRDRPFVDHEINLHFYPPTDPSFPANAAGVGFAIATAVFLRHRRLGGVLYVVSAIWGVARVYAGVHYPTDIVAGAVVGVIGALLAAGLVRLLAFIPRHVFKAFRAVYIA